MLTQSKVHGTRFTEKYLQARHALSRSTYSPYSSMYSSSARSPPASPSRVPPSSPPRKVVTEFASFGAPKTASVFGTAVASTPFSLAGGKAAFGGMRTAGRALFDEEDEEEEDGKQKVELREDTISLDQVRFLRFRGSVSKRFPGSAHRSSECMEKHSSVTFMSPPLDLKPYRRLMY